MIIFLVWSYLIQIFRCVFKIPSNSDHTFEARYPAKSEMNQNVQKNIYFRKELAQRNNFSKLLKRAQFCNIFSKLNSVTLSNKRHRKVKLHSASGVQFVTPDIFLNMAQSMLNVEPAQCSHLCSRQGSQTKPLQVSMDYQP